MKSAFISLLLLAIPTALASNHGNRLTRKHQARAAHAQIDQELIAKRSNLEVRDEHNHTLTKRAFSGRGTFYYTDVGLGACGQLSQNNEWTVALNTAQYGGGYPGPECFKSISISANGQTRSGIVIKDQCPTCGYGDLDLAPGLFTQFADEGAGVLAITWWFEGDAPAQPSPTPTPTSTWTPPTSTWTPPPSTSTSEWVAPTSTSTWVEPSPTSTWSPPPPSSSSSTWTPPPSSSSSTSSWVAPSSSSSVIVSSAAVNSTNPFAIVSSVSESATASASASAASSSDSAGVGAQGGSQAPLVVNSNLAAINGLVTNYGQIMVVAGGAA